MLKTLENLGSGVGGIIMKTCGGNNAPLAHGEIIYGDTRWIKDDCPDTFSEFIFPFPPAAALCDDFSLVDSVET